ncbi:alpha-humulene/(-)-(E)-beta-caryophyllene synthase [Citrus sinensis]|uniref:Alpha-humulene/(-)-(E)-beta-caryophyllene synthase n=1 Tax=Citrus sinensis TaxID=2711 RepID=A0ACB8P0N5_CITSI|nr:alpha-humulene/(-)-(E)-beta-caryophyllene synthase [Citrus sinensis]
MSIPLLAAVSSSTEETVRPIADFHPTLWGNHFLKSAADVETIDAATQEQHAALKQEVRRMITTTANKLAQKLHMIDAVQRLGVAYHFEKEIEDELGKVSHDLDSDDLYVVSLRFRLFRQQGVKISCDVFEKFKDDEGKFKESLINDIRGMLSLYEAAYLAIRGEDILDEAIVFTTTHLKSVISVSDHSHVNSNLAEQIRHSLQIPLRKAAARLEARYFLDIYSRDDLHDETLLKFAKLDFNILQAAHQKEASIMTRWWNDLGFPKKVPYARDRIVEIYIWMLLGVSYEPKLAFGRTFASKVICMISIIDDTFDAYSTFEELTLFTEAVTRWDIGLIDTLPEYMKFIFKALLDIYREAEEELAKERRSYGISYAKQTVIIIDLGYVAQMQELIMLYFTEAKWLYKGYIPSFDEYKSVALRSIGFLPVAVASFVDLGDFIATKDNFECILKNAKSVKATQTIVRFMDDIAGYKFEQKRGHIPSAVECYKNQHGVSEEEAVKELLLEVADSWKDINEELLNPTTASLPTLQRVLYFARSGHFIYDDGHDRYTHSLMMKRQVALLLTEPLAI